LSNYPNMIVDSPK